MGRRSINTTKSGKYMNPTDQARKEARKRELRKNKKQRLIVRTAVLKGKDPYQIIADMERLDQMEYNVHTPPPLNEKVLKDKRRKMRETWDRLCRLYMKDDHERFIELKRMELEYESKRNQMIKFFDAVKSAQEVVIDDIPLPPTPLEHSQLNLQINVNKSLIESVITPQSILKKNSLSLNMTHKHPPGVPPGPPPVLSDSDDNSDDEDREKDKDKGRKIRFSDDAPDENKEEDINEFLREIDQLEKSAADRDSSIVAQPIQSLQTIQSSVVSHSHGRAAIPPPQVLQNPSVPSAPPPMFMFRPPPGLRQIPPPSGAMIGNRPPMPSVAPMRQPLTRMPPPSVPPRMIQSMKMPPSTTLTAPPAVTRKDEKKSAFSDRATIEAKPQLRNLSADATRFTPVALRVKREDKFTKKLPPKHGYDNDFKRYSNVTPNSTINSTSKDDAYDQFMKEMENLID